MFFYDNLSALGGSSCLWRIPKYSHRLAVCGFATVEQRSMIPPTLLVASRLFCALRVLHLIGYVGHLKAHSSSSVSAKLLMLV